MKIALAFAFAVIATAAQAQSSFVPFTVTEKDAQDLRKFLDEQPLKFGLPMLQWIDMLEQRAVKAAADKPEDKKEAPDK